MTAAWFRLELRRRWRSLLVLALLVALAAATVMTAVAGARRGDSAVQRLAAGAAPVDVEVVPGQADVDWEAVRSLPEVEALATYVPAYLEIDGRPADTTYGSPVPVDTAFMHDLERPAIIDGRLADPGRADEVVVTPAFLDTFGSGLGDTVALRLYQPESVDVLAADPSLRADGPTIEASIVGVVRSPLLADAPGAPGLLLPSAGLYERYTPNLVGASDSVALHGVVHLDGGSAAMTRLKEGLTRIGGTDINVWEHFETRRFMQRTTGFEANGMLVFALAAGVAAVFLVGQSIARNAASTAADLQVMRALGMTPAGSRWAAAIGPVSAALVATLLGVGSAVVASRWFPMGTASLLEPSPGLDVDGPVLVTGLVAIPALVAAGALLSARSAARAIRPERPPRNSALAGAVARVGAPVPVVVGARFALEPGHGRTAVPVRPALVGAVTGVLGVLAAFTFSSGVSDAVSNPARFGQVHQLEVVLGYEGVDAVPADTMLDVLAADPDVAAVNDSRVSVAAYDGGSATVYAFDPVDTPLGVVVTEGRLPNGGAEIALAPFTADAMGAEVDDVVALTGTGETVELTVTGLAFVPESAENYYLIGAWVARPGYDALFDGFRFHTAHVALTPDADPAAVTARLSDTTAAVLGADAADPPLFTEPIPPNLAELQQIRTLPLFLAGFLAVLAMGAVGHAVATAVRRRRHDVGVLRALGMTRWQCRGVLVTQATVLALVGLAVGIPLGVAVGRTVWRYVTDAMLVHYMPPVSWPALLLAVPVTLLAATLLATWPSHRATSMRVGHALRAE